MATNIECYFYNAASTNHHLRINQGIRQDLAMWLQFFQDFNGVSVFNDRVWLSNEDIQLFTDSAAGNGCGFGIYFDGKWTYSAWAAHWRERGITSDITVLEFFPLLVSLYIWGEKLRNKKILFRCDNSAVVHIINSSTSKSKMVMVLLRAFTLKCLNLNIAFKASHIAGISNVLTDALSRLQIEKFHRLAPGADPDPEPVRPGARRVHRAPPPTNLRTNIFLKPHDALITKINVNIA